MSDPEDATTFEVVDTVVSTLVGNSADYYEHIIFSLENYNGNGQYIAFRVSNGESCGYRMDDLYITEIPSCIYPTNFHATNVSNEEVTLAWTESGSATQWNILYDVTGFDPETEGTTVSADANPYTITGLQNVTTYDFYVQADCGGMTSDWVGPLTLKTGVYNMGVTGSDTMTTCGMYIYDDGGADGNHSTYCDYTLVIYPETAGSGLSLSGSVNLYNGSSYYQGMLTIYEGVGTSGNVLGSFTGTQTVNIAYGGPVTMRLTTGSYYNYAGFEILVQCTECFPPSNLAVSGQTLDGATVTWSGSADSYEVVLGGAMSQTYTTTDTSYTFTGLTSSSSYTVKVRGICGMDSSLYSSTISFNTSCGAITITTDSPWFEDFEGYSGGGAQPFVCWETPITEVVDNGTSPFVYCGHAPACHSGANSAEFKGNNNMAVLPEFTNDIHDLRLEFWATTTNTNNYGTMEVGVVTDINDPTTFELLGLAGVPGPRGSGSGSGNGNYMGPFDFNGVQATSGRIALRFTGTTGLSWNLDDFTVSLAPNCPSPVKTSVQATNVDGHNATISFTDNDTDHNSWTVYYKPSADSVWSSEVTNTTTMTLTNLDPQTQYDVYVVTNCTTPDADEDATLTIHFTTTVACPAPTNVEVSNIGMTSATVTWNSNADSFVIEYGEAGFAVGTGTTATVTTNTYDLTGLTAGTTYTVYITADCGIDGSSTAASANFNTANCELADQCEYTFVLTDEYGDGWNGGSLAVQQNGITVTTLNLPSGSTATVTVSLCDNVSTTLVWSAGSFAYEAGFTLYGPDDTELYTIDDMSNYTPYTFTSNCTPPTCPKPASIEVTNITSTSAEVSWVSTGTETAWNVEYKTTNDATWTVIPVTTNPYTLTNLAVSTNYDVRVQADCGGGDVSDYRATSFVTACDVISQFPYTEGFENGLGCWENEIIQGSLLWTTSSSYYVTGSNSAYFNWTPGASTRLISPVLDLSGMTNPYVSFYHRQAVYSGAVDSLVVSYRTSASSEWVRLEGYSNATTDFAFDSLALPSLSSTYQIAFTGYGIDALGIYLDDITVYDASGSGPVITDPTVATAAASGISQTAATLNATITNPDNVTITAKGFEWMPLMGTDYTQVAGTGTGNTFTANLSNLAPNTDYIFKAFITYNGTTVYGNELVFTTLPDDTPVPCDVPTGLDTTNVANEVISITWDANANVVNWNVRYRPQNGQWTSATANTNGYTITGLTGSTTYEIQVQANCGDGNVSDWSASLFVTTKNVGISSWLENSVALYPNPAKEYVDIRVDGDVNVTSMEVYDVYGKLINTVIVVENPTRINVSNLANGMYFVRVNTEAGAVTKTFVKR
jgi:hypothetical protein